MRLTERAVKDLPPPAQGALELWDDDLPGFGLRVYPSGRKTWLARWRDKSGKKRFESAGAWPTVKAEEARRWARETLSRAAIGLPTRREENAAQEAATPASAPTVRDLWSEYEGRARGGEKLNRESIGRCHVLPVLGNAAVSELTPALVDGIVRGLADKPRTGTAVKIHMHGAYELARLLAWWPEDKTNPAARVKAYPYKPRSRVLSDEELASIGAALDDMRVNRVFPLLHAELLTLLLLTGARIGELMGATWPMLDTKYPALVLDRHKTMDLGVRRVEFGQEAARILLDLPRREDAIFYGHGGHGHISTAAKPFARVRKLAGIAHATVHDLRRTFASAARNDGMSEKDIGILLGHSGLSTTGIYAIPDIRFRQALAAQAEASVIRRLYPDRCRQ
jgi:integrase